MLIRLESLVIAVVAVVGLAGGLPALANDLQNHTIPASMCEPDGSSADKLLLSYGSYVFSGSNTGWATLQCPLPLGPWAGTPGAASDMPGFRVYYRDSDGTTYASRVFVRLSARRDDGSSYWGPWWDSNDHPETGYNIEYKATGTNLAFQNLYYFYVYLYRADTAQNTAFSGIDFVTPIL